MSLEKNSLIYHLTRTTATMGDWQVLFELSKNAKIKVELGTANGFGAFVLSIHGGKVYTIDKHNEVFAQRFIARYNSNIEAIQNDTVKEAKKWKDCSVGLLYIDAGHHYDDVKADYEAWYPKVEIGGVIAFHDCDRFHEEVWKFYCEELRKDKKIKEIEIEHTCKTIIKVFEKR